MARGRTTTVTVSDDGCTITFHHRIFFHDASHPFNAHFASQVADAEKRIRRTWQPPGGFRCGNCTVLFEFEFLPAEEGTLRDDCDGKHIFIGRGVSHQTGLGPERRPGCWFGNGPTLPEAPHEVGHELGMRDKYRFVRFDPNAPDDRSRWRPVPDDPRGVGRGANPRLPDDIRSVPQDGYPDNGLAFREDGVPQPADIEEILRANGVECRCDKAAPRENRGANEKAGTGKRTAAGKTGQPGTGGGSRPRIPPPWSETDLGTPPPAPKAAKPRRGGGTRPPEDPVIYGEEIEEEDQRLVLLVPGLMGSMLSANGAVAWPPGLWSFGTQIRAMLDPAVVKQPTGLIPAVYDDLLEFIERPRDEGGLGRTRTVTYEIFPYDWTSSCRFNARLMGEFIAGWLERLQRPGARVDVIAHSFGGLVSRVARRLGAPIARQVFLAVPHRGAPKAYFTLHPEITYAASLGILHNVFARALLWYHAIPGVPDREHLLWRMAMASDSTWELMPDDEHIGDMPHLQVDGRDTYSWEGNYLQDPWGFPPVFDATIADAMALKAAMGDPAAPFRNVIADDHPTPRSVNYSLQPPGGFGPVVEARPGDQTVLAPSAAAGGHLEVVDSGHVEIPADEAAHAIIRAFLG